VAVVDVPLVAAAADRVVAADARPVVVEAARVVEVRAVAADVPPVVAVAVDKVVAEEEVAQVVVAADFRAAVDREAEPAVVDVPAVAGAAETVNSLSSSGASRVRGAPFFIDALFQGDTFLAAVDRAAARHVFPAASLALARRRERHPTP
jgi:hypothetical protein